MNSRQRTSQPAYTPGPWCCHAYASRRQRSVGIATATAWAGQYGGSYAGRSGKATISLGARLKKKGIALRQTVPLSPAG
jgi:hypothetical protein